ncbi:MAG TPA: HPr-rel-A system PqqD family peptide chaperone [Casimicrobiaceae bacterium]
MTATDAWRWRIAPGQRLVVEDMDDGVLLYDALVGRTHLLNATAAEMLSVIEQTPGLTADEIRTRVAARLDIPLESLPLPAVDELLDWLARLCIVIGQAS